MEKQRKLCSLFINRSNSLKYQVDFILIYMSLIKKGSKKNRKIEKVYNFSEYGKYYEIL